MTLMPGDFTEAGLSLTGAPRGVHPVEIEVRYRTSGRDEVLRLVESIRLSPGLEQVDEFRQLGGPRADMLFVIDGSASMRDLVRFEQNLMAMASYLEASGIDINAAVTNTDLSFGGALLSAPGVSTVVSSEDPDFADRLVRNLEFAQQSTRSQLEQPLDATSLALEAWRRQGSLRSNASLSIIVLTDEDDQSPGAYEVLNRLFRIRGFRNSNLLTFFAVAGLGASDCPGPATAEPATRLRFVAERNGRRRVLALL